MAFGAFLFKGQLFFLRKIFHCRYCYTLMIKKTGEFCSTYFSVYASHTNALAPSMAASASLRSLYKIFTLFLNI